MFILKFASKVHMVQFIYRIVQLMVGHLVES